MLIETCFETEEDKKMSGRQWALQEVRSLVCSYLHQAFIADTTLCKLVHFQVIVFNNYCYLKSISIFVYDNPQSTFQTVMRTVCNIIYGVEQEKLHKHKSTITGTIITNLWSCATRLCTQAIITHCLYEIPLNFLTSVRIWIW